MKEAQGYKLLRLRKDDFADWYVECVNDDCDYVDNK